ncbi:MAG: CBS domain-containing protein [Planctomycetota bacterium]
MRCEQVMKREVEFVSGAQTVQSAAQRMRAANVGFLPVCDPSTRKVIGTITDRDIAIRIVADGHGAETKVADCMTDDVISCGPAEDLVRAEQLMSWHQKSRIVVTDDKGILVGVISLSDLARHDSGRATDTLRRISGRESRAA